MKEIESILNFPKQKCKAQKVHWWIILNISRRNYTNSLVISSFQKVEVEEILPSLFSEDSITVLRGPDKFYIYYSPIFLINIDTKFLNPILAIWI